jgi:hypothetical protein
VNDACDAQAGVDHEGADGEEERSYSPAKGKKKKKTKSVPRAHIEELDLGEAIAELDAFWELLDAADVTSDSVKRERDWARDLQRVEDRVATFVHYGCVRRSIAEAEDCVAGCILKTEESDDDERFDWLERGFCWGWHQDRREGKLPADSRAAAQAVDEAVKHKAISAGLLDQALRCYDAAQKIIGLHCAKHKDCGGKPRADLLSLSVALGNNSALASFRLLSALRKKETPRSPSSSTPTLSTPRPRC